MGDKTSIEWTDASWTPIRARDKQTGRVGWHCERVSPGCAHCYSARKNLGFFQLGTGHDFTPQARATVEIFLDEEMLVKPLHWKKPRKIFVCSMTDLFADFVRDEWIESIFDMMERAGQHTFQILTKRAERMRDVMSRLRWFNAGDKNVCAIAPSNSDEGVRMILPNVWMGVSVEDQKRADERTPLLLQTPAAIRFISAEPLLGPVDLSRFLGNSLKIGECVNCGVSLDDQMGQHHLKKGGGVSMARDFPSSHWLPSTLDGSEMIPSNEAAHLPLQPVYDGGGCAVDGNPDTVGPACTASPVEIPFAIEHSGDIANDRGIGGNTYGPLAEMRPNTAHRDSISNQTASDCFAGNAEFLSKSVEGDARLVSGDQFRCGNCGVLHTRHCTISWCIVGGESGPNARLMNLDWARSIVAQCKAAGVACFVKQLGAAAIDERNGIAGAQLKVAQEGQPLVSLRLKDKKGGDWSEWPAGLKVREFPNV